MKLLNKHHVYKSAEDGLLCRNSKLEIWKKIVFCKGNVEKQGEIIYLPWYMIMFYKIEEPEAFVYEVDLSALF